MTQDELRRAVARDATAHVVDDASIGVISDAMANFFIDSTFSFPGQGWFPRLGDRTGPSRERLLHDGNQPGRHT